MSRRLGAMPPEVVETVHSRSLHRCEAKQARGCTGRGEQIHHRKLRSQGGAHDVVNLLDVCHVCHAHIHANPRESYERGTLVRSMRNPGEVPVVRGRGRALPTESGSWIVDTAGNQGVRG